MKASWEATPFPEQMEFVHDTSRFSAAFSGVRGGKSISGAVKAAARIVREALRDGTFANPWAPVGSQPMVSRDFPTKLYWVVAPSYSLANIAWSMLRQVLAQVEPLILHEVEGAIWLQGGILIQRKTGSDERSLQGAKLSGVWVDEVGTLKKSTYLQLRNRLADLRGWMVMTGSPRPDSFTRDLHYANHTLAGLRTHLWPTAANPHIPREEVEHARATLPRHHYERDWEASFESFEGLIYDSFDANRHTIASDDIPTTNMEWYGGQDYGTASPGCWLSVGVHKPTGNVYVTDEVYEARLPITNESKTDKSPTWVSMVKPIYDARRVKRAYVDVSDGNKGMLAYNKAGISSVVVSKGSIIEGIRVVQRFLGSHEGEAHLFIDRACENLIREIRAYVFEVTSGGIILERPDKKCSDHALDALRYALISLFGITSVPNWAPPAPADIDWAALEAYTRRSMRRSR